jgi:hypothetical protein
MMRVRMTAAFWQSRFATILLQPDQSIQSATNLEFISPGKMIWIHGTRILREQT